MGLIGLLTSLTFIPLFIVSVFNFPVNFAINSAYAPSYSSEIYGQIMKLETPRESIRLYLNDYGHPKYNKQFELAMQNAINAKISAKQKYENMNIFLMSFSAESPLTGLAFMSYYDETINYLNIALKESYHVLEGTKELLADDIIELELVGADHPKNYGLSKQRYTEASELVQKITKEFYEDKPPSHCDAQDLELKFACAIQKAKKATTIPELVDVYNIILGDSKKDNKHSIVKLFHEFHSSIVNTIDSMKRQLEREKSSFENNATFMKNKLNELKRQDILLITDEIQNSIPISSENKISPGLTGSLSEQYEDAKFDLENQERKKSLIERDNPEGSDDYLFLQITKFQEFNSILYTRANQLNKLEEQFEYLLEATKTNYEKLKSSADPSNLFYLRAVELAGSAKSETKGQAIISYSKAIKYLKLTKEDIDLEQRIQYAERIIASLSKLGLDVNYEEAKLNNLKRQEDIDSIQAVYLEVENIIEKLRIKATWILLEVSNLKQEARSYLSISEEFLENPVLSPDLDQHKISGLRQEFNLAKSKEVLPNAYEIYQTYLKIIKYLKPKINSLSSKYLELYTDVRFFFDEIPRCNEQVYADVLVETINPLSITLENAVISKQVDLDLETDYLNFVQNKINFKIDKLEPGKIKFIEFRAKTQPLECSEPEISKLIDDEWITAVEVLPKISLSSAIVELSIKGEVLSIIPSSEFISQSDKISVKLKNLNEKLLLQVRYKLGEQNNQNQTGGIEEPPVPDINPITVPPVSNTPTQNAEKEKEFIDLNNRIQDICFFTECGDLKLEYQDAYEKYKKTGEADLIELNSKIAEHEKQIISRIAGQEAKEHLDTIKQLLGELHKGVDSEVELIFDESIIGFNEFDLSDFETQFSDLSKTYKSISSVSMSSAQPGFVELISKYSKKELYEFNERIITLKSSLNKTLNYIKSTAKTRLVQAGNLFSETNDENTYEYLKQAKDFFDSGYFTRSFIYSDYILKNFKQTSSFPFEYLIAGSIVFGFGFFMLKKPRRNKIAQRQMQRKLKRNF